MKKFVISRIRWKKVRFNQGSLYMNQVPGVNESSARCIGILPGVPVSEPYI